MADHEGATLDDLIDDLVQHLDLALFMDKLVSSGLIDSSMLSQLDNLINTGNRNSAVRKMLLAIKTNPPGYLETFVKILKEHPKTDYYGNEITAGDDEYFIDRYVDAIEQRKERLFDCQRLLAYKEPLIAAGAMTDKDYEDVRREYKRNRKQMEVIVTILLKEKNLKRFIGLSAVMYKYAEAAAEEMFPFINELGDRHPIKGNLKLQNRQPTDTAAQQPHALQQPHPSQQAQPPPQHEPLAAQQPLPTSDHCYKLLWMVAGSDDIVVVSRVISKLSNSSLSDAHSTDMVTYWEATLFNEVHLILFYPDQNGTSQACQHMVERFRPDMALLTGTCVTSLEIGNVKVGDLVISKTAVNIHSGMYEHTNDHRYATQVIDVRPSVIADLEVETQRWDQQWLGQFVDKMPSTTLTNQRLWYTRLYLELTKEQGDHNGWLKEIGWNTDEVYSGPNNKQLTERYIPDLRNDFRTKHYWEKRREQSDMLPFKPVHKEMIETCEVSMTLGETDFPPPPSTKTGLCYGAMLSTDRQPTGVEISIGRHHRNSVIAADMDTYQFYSCVKNCKVFLSVKGVFLIDDKLSELDHTRSKYSEYARLSSAAHGLQAIHHLYHKHCTITN